MSQGELTRKILAAGLVEKHVQALMERWGVLAPEAVEQIRLDTRRQFDTFVEDVDRLVQQIVEEYPPEIRLDSPAPVCITPPVGVSHINLRSPQYE